MRRDGSMRELLQLAWPVVLARIGIMTMGLTDSIVVGHHSSVELGYLHLGWAPTGVVLTTAVGLLVGVQVMTARHVGEGQPAMTGAVLRRGLVYALAIGFAAMALLWFGGRAMLAASGLAPPLVEGGGRVVEALAWSMPLYALAVACIFWLEALSKPVPGMIAMLFANVANIALNLWLVPELGAAGSAWATTGARGLMLVALVIYILKWSGSRTYGVFDRRDDPPAAAIEQRRVGYGAGASQFVEAAAFSGMSIVAGLLGALSVAAWGVVLNLSALVFMLPLGLSSATAVLVSRAWGEGDRAQAVRAGMRGFVVCTIALSLVCVAVWLAPGTIARAYTDDPVLIALAVPALILSCLFFVADGLQVVAAQALRARGDVLVPTVTHVISYALFMLPLGYVLAHPMGLGLIGIVWSVILASLLAAAFLLGRFALLARRDRGGA